jgi:hypothetical protein
VSVAILGVRSDLAAQMMNGWFVARATATLAIVVAAAIVAFFMSVPGAERSRLVRALPLAACLVWAVLLVGTIAANGSPLEVLLQVTPHPSCVLLIVATALLPGATLALAGDVMRHANHREDRTTRVRATKHQPSHVRSQWPPTRFQNSLRSPLMFRALGISGFAGTP